MIVKSTRIALEVVAGVLAVVVLLVVVALWRLSTGPVQLDFATPRIEAALSDPQRGLFVRVGSTELTWPGQRRAIEIHTRDVRIRNREGFTIAALPDVAIRLSLRALVQGVVAPTVIEVTGARISLVRGPDGNFAFARQGPRTEDAVAEADFSEILPSIVAQLMSKPVVDRPLSFLTAFRIVNGRVTVNDQKLLRVWEAPFADIELRRDSAGLAGDATLTIDLGRSQAELSGGFLYDRGTDRIDLSGEFKGLRTEALISLVPWLEPLAGLSISLDGSASASLAVEGTVDSLRFDIAGVDGVIAWPDYFAESLHLRQVRLLGRMSGPDRRVDLETVDLQFGTADTPGPRLVGTALLTATAEEFGGDLAIEAEATVTGLSMQGLEHYYPLGVGGRRWVLRNISHGMLDELVARIALDIPDGRAEQIELRQLDGSLRYHDLEVHYWRPMPPVTEISGTAVFDHRRITFSPQAARLLDLDVGSGSVEVFGLDSAKETIDVDLHLAGPLRTSLQLLDHERLGLIGPLGIDPAGTDGRMAGNLKFRFPIHVDPTFDNMEMGAEVELEDATLRGFLHGQDVTEGRLALSVDKTAMEVRGPVRFGGVLMDVVWNEDFGAEAPVRSQLEARIPRIDATGRAALGLDFAPFLEGPVSANISYTGGRSGGGTLRAVVDLKGARLALEPLLWDKPAGLPGSADVSLGLVAGRLTEIERLDISAGTLRARGAGRFDDSGTKIASLALEELVFGNNRLTEVAVDWLGEGVVVRLGGGVLDAAPLLAGDAAEEAGAERGPQQAGEARTETGSQDPVQSAGENENPKAVSNGERENAPKRIRDRKPETSPKVFQPFALIAPRLDKVYFGPDRFLEAAELELRRGRGGWQRIGLEARIPRPFWSPGRPPEMPGHGRRTGTIQPGKATPEKTETPPKEPSQSPPPEPVERRLEVDFGPRGEGRYGLWVATNDMGAALRALDLRDTIHGGRVVIKGRSDGPLPGSPLHARIEAHDYVLIEAPALARVLTMASLTGLGDVLRGKGIRLDRLVGEFSLTDGLLETDLIRAYGSALGLTARGRIDFDASLADLEGTVVPAYSVNRILGKIPLLGPLLTGGKGEGLLAVTYHMTGDLNDPEVSINPLSVLAPGFLRGLFRGTVGGGENENDAELRALPERAEP
ncbi:MAG: AsmA-like C-terminal domain-containing protein [Kiloniellales bacterium]